MVPRLRNVPPGPERIGLAVEPPPTGQPSNPPQRAIRQSRVAVPHLHDPFSQSGSRAGAMVKTPESVARFLRGRRIAVAGVSRHPGEAANAVFRKLRGSGYEVFPINPRASEVEGAKCYSDVGAVPGQLDGVVIATSPDISIQIVRQCLDHGVLRVWFHRSFGNGSVSDEAVRECAAHGIDRIVGGCPLMFCDPVDFGHTCMRWWLQRQGRVPK